MPSQPELFTETKPVEEAHSIFCHQDFLQKLEESRKSGVGKRASLLMERLAVDPRREFYKSTLGLNKGWRRSRLGGHGGSHFYAWWVPKGAPPLRNLEEFEAAPEGSIFLRDIRHHDDHSELNPQSLEAFYLPVTARDMRTHEYGPSPLTPVQIQFTAARQKVRIIEGYPGSGKTTALWHATDQNCRRSALYVTYSKDLAGLARTFFDRFAPGNKRFHVLPFARLVRELSGVDAPIEPESAGRSRFLKELATFSPRVLGAWADDRKALYDEIHAHFVGEALPIPVGRFNACDKPRLPDRVYREQRRRFIGGAAADVVLEVMHTLDRRQPNFHELFFPELLLAWKALERLHQPNQGGISSGFLTADCIAVDETQDLTPLEALVVAELCLPTRDRTRRDVTLLMAGDEGQTVRPTDFDWGWLQDMLYHTVGSPHEFNLTANLRSPRRIAELVNSVWQLYRNLAKQDRPSGRREAEIDNEASDQLLYCGTTPGPELDQLLRTFASREGLAIISLTDEPPAYVSKELRSHILTVSEAKGLDFQSVCILDAGECLHRIVEDQDPNRRDAAVEPLTRRLAIDKLRVAFSRPTERIYFLDVASSDVARDRLLSYLQWVGKDDEVARAIPATVLKTLEEELLDPEERVRLCEADALQFLDPKPELAWARAQQAVALVGRVGEPGCITDDTVRQSAFLTAARVFFSLYIRGVRLPAEIGKFSPVAEAVKCARMARRHTLAETMLNIEGLRKSFLPDIAMLVFEQIRKAPNEFEPWFAVEVSTYAPEILRGLEESLDKPLTAHMMLSILPDAYKFFGVADAEERILAQRRRVVQKFIEAGYFPFALKLLEQDPAAPPLLRAGCLEGMGKHAEAADLYRSLGKLKDALRNYRSIPDFVKALDLMREMGGEPAAAESMEWIAELQEVLAKRPANLLRTATAAEKKYLNALFEAQLDGPRAKKPVRPRVKRT